MISTFNSTELAVKFNQTTLVVSEEVGEVLIVVSIIGKTNLPINVDVIVSGTADEAIGINTT